MAKHMHPRLVLLCCSNHKPSMIHLRSFQVSQLSRRWMCRTNCLESGKKIFDDSNQSTRQAVADLTELKDKGLYAEYKQTEKGVVFDNKPIKYNCIAGKAYIWCSCGRGHHQPFCDGTHRDPHLKIKLKPIRFDCQVTKEYWFCNCKQTNSVPFCDGSCRLLA